MNNLADTSPSAESGRTSKAIKSRRTPFTRAATLSSRVLREYDMHRTSRDADRCSFGTARYVRRSMGETDQARFNRGPQVLHSQPAHPPVVRHPDLRGRRRSGRWPIRSRVRLDRADPLRVHQPLRAQRVAGLWLLV